MENTSTDTNNFLNWVEIKNFKSIKELRLDCKRVNIFIGKPNVGKSNVLEGLGMLGAGHNEKRFLVGSARYERLRSLFFDNIVSNRIQIDTNKGALFFESIEIRGATKSSKEARFLDDKTTFRLTYIKPESYKKRLEKGYVYVAEEDDRWIVREPGSSISPAPPSNMVFELDKIPDFNIIDFVKKYDFVNTVKSDEDSFNTFFSKYLLPPNGLNLYSVVRENNRLWKEFADLFSEQDLELVLFDEKQEFLLQKRIGPQIWQYPFISSADTFRRFMFYITAIESNKNSVIVFEEPEVHSFPPYTQEMAYRMIYDESNQYFISTHSPYMLHPFIEKMDYKDLNVFITYYKNYQTHVRALTAEELTDILDYSTNVFFNLRKFEPNA